MEHDETLPDTSEAAPSAVVVTSSPRLDARDGAFFCPVRGIRAGATQQLLGEDVQLLRRRLLIAAGLLATASLVASARFLLVHPLGAWLPALSAVVLLCLGGIVRIRPDLSSAEARAIEVAMFGLLLLGFSGTQYMHLDAALSAGDYGMFRSLANRLPGLYVVIMTTYAILIPNTWRRATRMVGAMVLAPIVVDVAVHAAHPSIRDQYPMSERIEYNSFAFAVLVLGAAIAIIGVHTINGFRRGKAESDEAGMYRLVSRLGAGGMGEVWKAEHRLLARPAAIKMIRPELLQRGSRSAPETIIGRFRREARSTARLESPHTVQLHDFGVARDGTFFYVMEYLEGYDLADLVERFGPVPPTRAIWLLRQAAESLGEAHRRGLVHRDVKPANVFVGRRAGHYDWVRVLDFGLVKTFSGEQETKLTMEGSVTGTPAFFPPEMARGAGAADARSDVYALSAVAYWLLTGDLVFPGHGPMDMVARHMRDEPEPPSRRAGRPFPPALESLVLRGLAKRPEDRPQSMEEFTAALDAVPVPSPWDEHQAQAWWSENGPVGWEAPGVGAA